MKRLRLLSAHKHAHVERTMQHRIAHGPVLQLRHEIYPRYVRAVSGIVKWTISAGLLGYTRRRLSRMRRTMASEDTTPTIEINGGEIT